MKRCPQCNRVEADDALVFCRTDGAALVRQEAGAGSRSRRQTAGEPNAPLGSEAGTAQLGSVDANEVHTSILPHNTDATFNRVTGPTTSLPATSLPATSLPLQSPTGTTQELSRTRRRRILIPVLAAILLIGIVLAAWSLAGRFMSPAKVRGIESVAVLPFENKSGNAFSLSKAKWRWMSERKVDSLDALFHEKAVFVREIQEASVRFIDKTAILLNKIRLVAVVGGNEVTNPFMVTEVYVQKAAPGS